jgi:hypothetical protein
VERFGVGKKKKKRKKKKMSSLADKLFNVLKAEGDNDNDGDDEEEVQRCFALDLAEIDEEQALHARTVLRRHVDRQRELSAQQTLAKVDQLIMYDRYFQDQSSMDRIDQALGQLKHDIDALEKQVM